MSAVDDYLNQSSFVAKSATIGAMDDDPDQAAEALDLESETGVPSTAIYGDLDGFNRQYKAKLASDIISGNQYVADWLSSHPMAPRVAHDDLGQLDTTSQALQDLPTTSRFMDWLRQDHALYDVPAIKNVVDPATRSFMSGFGDQPLAEGMFSRPQDIEWALSHPVISATAAAAVTPFEFAARAANGLLRLGHDGTSAIFGEGIANELQGMAEWAMMRGDVGVHAEGGPITRIAQNEKLFDTIHDTAKAMDLASPWVRADLDPPPGLHPLIDKAKNLQAKEDIDALDNALAEASKSATRERSPELFANFVRSHIGDREIGIDPEAVRSLYGDKVPTRDDNLLGWVPDLDQRLASAELTGGDVRVPLADWLANVEPDVAKELHDDIRVRDGGLTLNEGKIEAEPKEVGTDPVQQIRGSAGLEPLEMAGDRQLTLKKIPSKPGTQFGEEQGFHDIAIKDENGKDVGTINLSKQGKKLYIEMIQAGPKESGFYQPNFLGPSLIRSIKQQLKAMFPDAETITGHRVSGAREKAKSFLADSASPEVKLDEGPLGWSHIEPMRELLQGFWERATAQYDVKRGPYTLEQSIADQAIREELDRIVPQKVTTETAQEIRKPATGARPRGFYQRSPTDWPRIFVALDDPEMGLGVARHEAIHHLRRYGFLDEGEWNTLTQAAKDNDWHGKYLRGRYAGLSPEALDEEAVAEGFRAWMKYKDKDAFPEGIAAIFEKIKQLIQAVKTRYKELAGKDLDWEEIFRKIDTGEIGGREGTVPLAEGGQVPFNAAEAERKPTDYGKWMGKDKERVLGPAARLGGKVYRGITHPLAAQEALKTVGKTIDDIDTEPELEAEGFLTSKDRYLSREEAYKLARETGQIGDEDAQYMSEPVSTPEGKLSFKERQTLDTGDLVMSDATAQRQGFKPQEAEREEGEGFGLYDKAKALGVTQSHMDRMLRLIDRRNKEDFDAANKRAEVRQRRRSNKDWKERRTVLRDEVSDQLQQRPDIAMDRLFAKQKIKFDPAYLTEDQKLRLPKDYVQKKDGVNPDDLAPYFGYTSGDALVERLGMLTEDRRRSGMSQRDYFNRLTDVETDRRLNAEFGDREANILDEAKDQALSETQLNLVHEETLAMAIKAGQEPAFTREEVRDMVKAQFDQQPVGSISSTQFLQASGKIGKKIEEAGAKGKWDEAYRLSQQRNHAVLYAKFARDYERQRAQFDRVAKQFRKREVASVPAEYTNWVHDILQRVGYSVNRSVQDLAENIGRQSEKTLRDFVEAKERDWMGQRELPVADFLFDPNFRKPVDELSHHDFMGLKQSVDTLVKAGRDEKKIIREGEAWDREQAIGEMRDKLETFGYKPTKSEPRRLTKWPRAFIYGLTNMETLLNRWDRGEARGIFNRLITYPLAEAANGKARLQREIAALYKDLSKPKDLDKLVDAPFPDPRTRTPANPDGDGPWDGFRRSHVLAMLQNAGNESNWKVLARGYGADPVALFKWLQKNVTREDIERAEGLGSIFKSLIRKSDNVYERMTGATVEKIPLKPLEFKLADGTTYQSQGWYHPLIADPIRKTVHVQDPDTGLWSQVAQGKKELINDSDFFHFATANGYTKRRTGAIYPLDLDFNLVPTRMKQMIHDISFREVVHETQKVFGDARFQEDVMKYYGREYGKGLMPYLRAVAGAEGINSEGMANAASMSEFLRQNVISTYIGFNPFTVLKHGPTAAVMSSREVGPLNFASAVKTLYFQAPSVAKITNDFVMKNSEEIQRRERHWQDTIAGQGREITGAGNLREKVIQAGSAAVAWSDMVSAKPTWLAAYDKALADGLSHGESVSLADRAVRRAHGSTAETNQPPLVRAGGPLHSWLTSVYGFFGTAMQRRIETAHKLNDAWELGKDRQIGAAGKKLGSAFGDFMTYMVWPTIVEEAVSGIGTDDHRTLGQRVLSGATAGLSSSFLYIRDIIHGAVSGHEPGVGLLSSALHDVNNVIRDIGRGTDALNRQHAAKTVGDLLTLTGEATGMLPKTVSNIARYAIGVREGQEQPRSIADVLLGAAKGTQKRRVEK